MYSKVIIPEKLLAYKVNVANLFNEPIVKGKVPITVY